MPPSWSLRASIATLTAASRPGARISQRHPLAAVEDPAQAAKELARLGIAGRQVNAPESQPQVELHQRAVQDAAVLAVEQQLALAIEQLDLERPGARRLSEMVDDRLGGIEQDLPARLPQPRADVGILQIEDERLVHAADLLE